MDASQLNGIPSVRNYNYKDNLSWSSKNDDITETQLFDLVTQRYTDIVNSTTIRFFKADEQGRSSVTFKPLDDASNFVHLDVKEQKHRLFGKCYSIRPSKHYLELGIYYLKLTL